MKAVSVVTLKKELRERPQEELVELCLRLAKFKLENKELLTYLLFEREDETVYVQMVKETLGQQFDEINTNSFFYIKKSIRKILRQLKKYARYSLKKETEVELLLYFCQRLKDFRPRINKQPALVNLYDRQIATIKKLTAGLHEDLQHDYELELEKLTKL